MANKAWGIKLEPIRYKAKIKINNNYLQLEVMYVMQICNSIHIYNYFQQTKCIHNVHIQTNNYLKWNY